MIRRKKQQLLIKQRELSQDANIQQIDQTYLQNIPRIQDENHVSETTGIQSFTQSKIMNNVDWQKSQIPIEQRILYKKKTNYMDIIRNKQVQRQKSKSFAGIGLEVNLVDKYQSNQALILQSTIQQSSQLPSIKNSIQQDKTYQFQNYDNPLPPIGPKQNQILRVNGSTNQSPSNQFSLGQSHYIGAPYRQIRYFSKKEYLMNFSPQQRFSTLQIDDNLRRKALDESIFQKPRISVGQNRFMQPQQNEEKIRQMLEKESMLKVKIKEKLQSSLHKNQKKSLFFENKYQQQQSIIICEDNQFEEEEKSILIEEQTIDNLQPQLDQSSSKLFKEVKLTLKKDFQKQQTNNRYDFIFDESLDEDIEPTNRRELTETPVQLIDQQKNQITIPFKRKLDKNNLTLDLDFNESHVLSKNCRQIISQKYNLRK
ncbi:UNKNOWN [Stylonychia lemnae]|uniref:Uncharacterized protein n=1 Tax=Stylonychia lemnae TaxID=5949 RepID=A0A078ALF4_STYLE|nr:UNKNOWN [Stylonychia lemnae]|eukprot:CDW83190.1 UNKNOWN [Stylonychia lemnae]